MNAQQNYPEEPARARVQLNARISAEMDERMRQYQIRKGLKRQRLLELAIEEYLNRHDR